MTSPVLSVPASGYQGRGYLIPTRTGADGKPLRTMGVTTALGALEKPGVLQWTIDNVVAYCVANIDGLLNRTEEQGFGFARFYHKRLKESDFDDPLIDFRNASNGVLNDLAELGTVTHQWIEDYVNGRFEPEITRDEQAEMIEKFLLWEAEHDIQVIASEATVVGVTGQGHPYAGTLDHIWIIDGIPTLLDVKTSRSTREEHYAQLAALSAAQSMIQEVAEGTEGAVEYKGKWWIEVPIPEFTQHAILHLRPGDFDNHGTYIEPFCKLKIVSEKHIEAGWALFQSAVSARIAQRMFKDLEKEENK